MANRGPTFFAKTLSRYFFEYLPSERGLSQETIQSYRDAMSLLLDFCEQERKIRRDKLEVSDFNRELIDAFFRWLEQEKGNSITTRNQRRAAINGNVKKCAVGKHPKSEKLGGIGSGCRLRLHPLPVPRRRQPKRVACIDPDAVVVDKNIAKNDRFDLFSR